MVCYVNLGYNETVCRHLGQHKPEQKEIQALVSLVVMYTNIASAVPQVIICLFAGPWSDRHGRKPLILAPLLGCLITKVIMLVLTFYVREARAEWYIIISIYSLFGGGQAGIFTALYSYMSDITRQENRTSRIAILEVFLMIGFPLGNFLSAKIYLVLGYYGVFGLAAAMDTINLIYSGCFVKETRGPRASLSPVDLSANEETADQLQEGGNWAAQACSYFLSSFSTCFEKRAHKMRRVIILMVFVMMINCVVFSKYSITRSESRKLYQSCI